jgi:hypothetical protein
VTGRRNDETWLVYEILRAWGASSLLRIWRSNTGVAKMGDRSVRFGVPGQGDISGLLLNGRRLEIECKTAKGTQSDEQKAFQRMIEAFGGLYVLARSLEDFDKAMAALGFHK